ncbi:MAG: hypothetical protein M3Q65_17735 [Chloroflexota bacterium]|nr:hypothetical protein [Chloroflexota bacterium]
MGDLWASGDCAEWSGALAAYPGAVAALPVAGLGELDAWYREVLPGILAARDPAHLTLDELERITRWKMGRGVWRARNLALVRGNDPDEVRRLSAEALALMPDPRRPVALLARLAGVGPATASAVLAAARPDVYPFFDEVVAEQIPGLGPTAFTLPYYLRYADRLRERAAALGAPCPGEGWTAHLASQALWANAEGGTRGGG